MLWNITVGQRCLEQMEGMCYKSILKLVLVLEQRENGFIVGTVPAINILS